MDRLFLQILNMSITASYVILFVIIVRLLLKKAPKIYSYALWSVVLFRLICPFSFESIFSLIRVSPQTVPYTIINAPLHQINSGISVPDQPANSFILSPAAGSSADPMQIWITTGEAVWLSGIAVLLIYSILTSIRLYLKLKKAMPVYKNVCEMNEIKTPFVFGIFQPKIFLPHGLSEKEKTYIIKHEQTHIKRFDNIIKPLAFFIISVHWFNPLAWVAFYLMSEDMELSCDESVIKQMGSGIKKDYSASLLSLSAGRRIMRGCPLAFGENNTKSRIVNVLNYKKPAFLVIIVSVIAVAAVCIGLMTDPQTKELTIEDYAGRFIDEQIAAYESGSSGVKITESKITRLEKIAEFNEILSSPLEIWRLEYRLKPDDISKAVLPGGMNAIDGWITEDSSMGKPILVFSYDGSDPNYIGCTWTGEADVETAAGQETALRSFLEGVGLLPHETFAGNHVIVKFPLSTGETCQLLLSQPVVQGEHGIWCAERWMDGNGSMYFITPEIDSTINDYYNELQKQCDEGHRPMLLDPLQVALDYINSDNGLGQNVSPDEIIAIFDATAEDFLKTPESHFIGYISDFDIDKFSKPSFHFDQIEWITADDTDRLAELNVDPDELTNGYYIYNPESYPMFHQVSEHAVYNIIDREGGSAHMAVTLEEFAGYLEGFEDYTPPFRIVTKDGHVQSITEQYVP